MTTPTAGEVLTVSDAYKFPLPPLPKPDPSLYRGPLYTGDEVKDYARLSNSVLIGQNEDLRARLAAAESRLREYKATRQK